MIAGAPIRRLALALSGLGRVQKSVVLMMYDGAAMLIAIWLSFCIRLSQWYWPEDPRMLALVIASVVAGLGALLGAGVYRVVIRYMDVNAASHVALGAALAGGIWFVFAFMSKIEFLSRSVGLIYSGLLFLLMFFGRVAAFWLLAARIHPLLTSMRHPHDPDDQEGVAIYGANEAGHSLAESLRHSRKYRLRCFVDDHSALVGRRMRGFPIRSVRGLRKLVVAGKVKQVFLAIPEATRAERVAAISSLAPLAVKVKTLPTYEEIVSGRYAASHVRPIKVEDLLSRDVVPPLKELIDEGIVGRSILVTGAGGSIGSEICRQVLAHRPRRIVLLDHSEYALFTIETQLKTLCARWPEGDLPELVPVMGSLLNDRLISRLLKRIDIDTIFHAAAYKHVPLLEDNEVVGVENNVLGTRVLADAAVAAGVERLTMISTDKAVRPTNVMGASKRVAELYIQALAKMPEVGTRFGIVRFGNVLDSSGSVVQHFRKQIREGGPVTVTDPEITRFFMSIPEATQLVLQANSMAVGGEVFVLDMGEPVKIIELARTMIALSGMTEKTPDNPHGEIEIVYVGLRRGEKLHEELFIGEAIGDTAHPQIKMADERSLSIEEMRRALARLTEAIHHQDAASVRSILSGLLLADHAIAA